LFEYTSINQYQLDLTQDKTTCTEAVRHYLSQIDSKKLLNAFVNIFSDEALELAEERLANYMVLLSLLKMSSVIKIILSQLHPVF
jgi:Asp-tRNA(Asn)/Glu-tRNA(Gln) amidotransferase A subunit family amidase